MCVCNDKPLLLAQLANITYIYLSKILSSVALRRALLGLKIAVPSANPHLITQYKSTIFLDRVSPSYLPACSFPLLSENSLPSLVCSAA